MRFCGALASALILRCAVAAAQAPAAGVLLDLVVDDARSRRPLAAGDLVVADAQGPLPIASLRLVDGASGTPAVPLPAIESPADERAAADSADRLVGIYLDEYHLTPGPALDATRAAIASFVRTQLGPRDLVVALKPLDSLSTIRLGADRDAAARAIESTEGRSGDYTPRSSFEQQFIAGAPARIDEARAQIALSALSGLATHLGQFSAGRKTLLVVSDGVVPAVRARRTDILPGFDTIGRSAMRGRVAVYALSPSSAAQDAGVSGGGQADAHATALSPFRRLAEETSGAVFEGAAGMADALQRIAREASRYYLVAVEPRAGQRDGGVHRVIVTARDPGTRLRARAGFSIAEPVGASRSSSPGVMPATRLIPRRSSPLIRPWFGLAGGDAERVRINVVWEPARRLPGVRAPAAIPQRVRLDVTTPDGTPVFSGTSVAAGDAGIGGAPGERSRLTFEASPGALLLQMEILDGAGRVLDRDVRDLAVRPFPAPMAFGTTEVFRARTARERRTLIERADVPPTSSREFSRTEHVVLRLPLVGSAEVDVTARLVSAYGAVMRELPVTRLDTPHAAQVVVGLAGLAPGAYTVRFEAHAPSVNLIERVAFTLMP